LLVLHAIPFPKVHDLEKLVRLLPDETPKDWPVSEQRRLTMRATALRTPGDYEPIRLDGVREAVRFARRVRAAVRRLLPTAAVRP